MSDRHQQKPYPLRMTDELRARLETAAEAGLRSLHSEIVWRLERTLRWDEAEKHDPRSIRGEIQETVQRLNYLLGSLNVLQIDEEMRKDSLAKD